MACLGVPSRKGILKSGTAVHVLHFRRVTATGEMLPRLQLWPRGTRESAAAAHPRAPSETACRPVALFLYGLGGAMTAAGARRYGTRRTKSAA